MELYFRFTVFMLMSSVLIALCVGCSYSINLVQSSGTGQDKIDDEQTADPNISPSVPISIVPSSVPKVMSKRLGK